MIKQEQAEHYSSFQSTNIQSAVMAGSPLIPGCPAEQINVALMVQSKEKRRLCFHTVAAGEANYNARKLTDRIDAHD